MKVILLYSLFSLLTVNQIVAQKTMANSTSGQAIFTLIDNYAQAREKQDTAMLKSLLTREVDQLVSSGEWRSGIAGSLQGMMRSSDNNPGTRTLTVEQIRFLNSKSAIVDARYEIQNANGSIRKMWSTFIVVKKKGSWKITAIRNMMPTGSNN